VPISNSLNSKIRRVYVISQFFASDLNQHILATFHQDRFLPGGLELLSPEETVEKKVWFKGTADAVRQNLSHFRKTSAEYFLILSGDQLYNMDFKEMINFAKRVDADLVIATLGVQESEARRMGVMKINDSCLITEFFEKPKEEKDLKRLQAPPELLHKKQIKHASDVPHYLGSMGIYVFKRAALFSLLTEHNEDDFGKHLIPRQIKKGRAYSYLFNSYWEDIGTVESFYQANLALAARANCLDTYDENHPIYTRGYNLPSPLIKNATVTDSLISQGAIIEACEITHSVIGVRSHIKKGTVIRDSIIMGNHSFGPNLYQAPLPIGEYSIGENCMVHKAIIDEQTQIGNNVQLINKNNLQTFDGDGIYIRDGIIIVTTGTHLPDGYTL
jgi:glucose-1-phosphate adenylyltransferase